MNEIETQRQKSSGALLRIKELEVNYGGMRALSGVSLSILKGEVVTVIGANGAGKSSLLNAIVGIVKKRSELFDYAGQDISRMTPEALVSLGITLVPENRELFPDLTVQDNLRVGAYQRRNDKRAVREGLEKVYETFPRLAERKRQHASTMSGGEQQMLAVGRAMMMQPSLFLLDEPSLGLAPLIATEIYRVLELLKAQGGTVLLVEQNARAALQLADYGYVMETGGVVLSGPAETLARDERVVNAYLRTSSTS